jgi:O-antigen/teichoic acid export membrane protein
VLDIALIPKFGINGAAVASSVAYILFTALTLMSFAIITKFDLKKTWALVIELQGDILLSIVKTRQRFGI